MPPGVYAIGVGHGDGLGGSSLQLGRAQHSDEELIGAAASVVSRARLAVTLVPGIGTKDHLRRAAGLGARLVRIATHCTEADVSVQHIALARDLDLEVHGDLMMPHLTDPGRPRRAGGDHGLRGSPGRVRDGQRGRPPARRRQGA